MICYRFASYSTPLRVLPSSDAARFNGGDDAGPTQYLALHPVGPLAELMRRNDLREVEQVRSVRTRTWALEVDVSDLPELTFDNAEGDFGIAAADVVGDDHGACRALASRLRGDVPGVIAPSAALPGTRNVILFGPRVAAPYLTDPVSTLDVPASITAQDGRALLSLLDVVRFEGDSHAALEAWERGTSFEFVEPDWALTREQP